MTYLISAHPPGVAMEGSGFADCQRGPRRAEARLLLRSWKLVTDQYCESPWVISAWFSYSLTCLCMFELHGKGKKSVKLDDISAFRWVCALLLGVAGLSARRAGDCQRTAHSFEILPSSQAQVSHMPRPPTSWRKIQKMFLQHEHPSVDFGRYNMIQIDRIKMVDYRGRVVHL